MGADRSPNEEKALRDAVRQGWKQTELRQHFNDIKKAIEQNDISSFVHSLYKLGIYNCQKAKSFQDNFPKKEPNLSIFFNEFKGLSDSLPDKMHEFLEHARHVAQSYYMHAKQENADSYDQLGYEVMFAGVTACMRVLYPEGSKAYDLHQAKLREIEQDFKGKDKKYSDDGEFRDELARPVINALENMIQQKRMEGYGFQSRSALDNKENALSEVKAYFNDMKGQIPDLNPDEQLERIKTDLIEKDSKIVNKKIKELKSAASVAKDSILSSLLEYRAKNFEKGDIIPDDKFQQLADLIISVASIEPAYKKAISGGIISKSMSQEKKDFFVRLKNGIKEDLESAPPKSFMEIYHNALYSLYSERDKFIKKDGKGKLIDEIGKWLPNVDKAAGVVPLNEVISKALETYFKKNSQSVTKENFIELYSILSAIQPILKKSGPNTRLEKTLVDFLNKTIEGTYGVNIELPTFKRKISSQLMQLKENGDNDELQSAIAKALSQIVSTPPPSPRSLSASAAADFKWSDLKSGSGGSGGAGPSESSESSEPSRPHPS